MSSAGMCARVSNHNPHRFLSSARAVPPLCAGPTAFSPSEARSTIGCRVILRDPAIPSSREPLRSGMSSSHSISHRVVSWRAWLGLVDLCLADWVLVRGMGWSVGWLARCPFASQSVLPIVRFARSTIGDGRTPTLLRVRGWGSRPRLFATSVWLAGRAGCLGRSRIK